VLTTPSPRPRREALAMTLRQLVLVTHRWLGLSTGLILTIAGVTGTVMVFATGWLHQVIGPLHTSLAAGRPGTLVVLAATAAALLLEAGGLVLWWRRKLVTVETGVSWRRGLADLHHVTGVFGLALMVILAATAVMMPFVTVESDPWLRKVIVGLHTTRDYGWAVKTLLGAASLGFAVQGVTGVVMWWKPGRMGAGRQSAAVS
jgi:uncharacterized iron-regulated membrane protein